MGEATANAAYMYDEVEGIRNLNKVEGFDPRKYMRIIEQEGRAGKYYLDVAFRKLWFRLKYPEGKIVKKILKLTDQVAIVEARVYLHRNDAEENFIANALDGALAGSATNLMDCMRTAVKKMGIPLEAAVACATMNPAKAIGEYENYGSITPGKKADVVLLDGELEIKGVIKGGVRL